MKVNILNTLIVDPETIEKVSLAMDKVSKKENLHYILFQFKDGSRYSITYGTAKKKSVEENEIISMM